MNDSAAASGATQAVPRVCAVIVTFNRLALLQQTLAAVFAQTAACADVVIVDNCSSDGTAAWLAEATRGEPRLTIVSLPTNTGGAGGFHAGVKRAYELGAEWLWLMDDDCVAAPDALARLLQSAPFVRRDQHPPLGFLASRVCWTDGGPAWLNIPQVSRFDWNALHGQDWRYTKIHAASFVSVLVSRAAVKKVGLPVRQFFIWFDDVEYTSRISHAGFAAYYIVDSTVTHVTVHNVHPQDYGNLKTADLWKHRYGLRNEVAVESGMRMGWIRGLSLIVRRLYPLWQSGQPPRVILTLLMAGLRGLVFNYKRHIEFADEK